MSQQFRVFKPYARFFGLNPYLVALRSLGMVNFGSIEFWCDFGLIWEKRNVYVYLFPQLDYETKRD